MASIGQLAATTPAEIVAVGVTGKPRTLSLLFYNAHATDDQQIEITLTRGSETVRTIFKDTIKVKEKFVVSNLTLEATDQLKAAATAATSVNYVILPGSPGGLFDAFSVDATGARKAVATAAGLTFTTAVSLPDSVALKIGTGDDITVAWDGTDLDVLQAAENSSIKWGISGAGIDQVWYGDTAAANMTWDQSADSLIFGDNGKVVFGTGSDLTMYWNATDLLVAQAAPDSVVKWGISGAGINHLFYGDTATCDMTWDQTNDQLLFNDNTFLAIGTGAGSAGDIRFSWDATRLNVTQLTTNSEVRWGVDGAGLDQMWYGDTASTYLTWDQSADSLILGGVAKIKAQTIVAAHAAAIPVTHSGSFPITQNGAETNTLADPTYLGQWLTIFVDTDTSGARVITAASRINQAANTIITMTEVGDFIKLEAITIAGALKWQVVANDGAVLS